jgi:hypothetical protein
MVGLAVGLVACSSGPETETVKAARSALVANQANVFGFEDPAHWQSSVALSSSTTHTQGAVSLGVKAKGYTEVTSVALPSLTGVTGLFRIDLLLPTAQPNPFWLGTAQLFVSVPSKGVNNEYLGLQELTGKPLNQFFSLDFNLPQALVTTLQAGGYSDFKVKVVLNVPFDATGTYLVDNLRFVAGQTGGCGDFVEGNVLATWTTGSSDGAATTLSVLASGAVRGSQALRAVTNSGFDFWVRYNAPAPINASAANELRVAVRGNNTTPIGWQENGPILVVEDTAGARIQFQPRRQLLSIDGLSWNVASVPITGAPNWITSGGPVNWSSIRAVEIHADTWDFGFTLDVDAVSFERTGTTCECATACGAHGVCNQDHLYCDCNLGWGGTASCSACAAGFSLQGGACVLQNDGVSTVWPNQFSKAASDPWLAVHHDEIQTVKPNVLVVDFVNVSNPTQDQALINQLFAAYREASRMQGFKNPSQASQLQYQLAKFVDLRDGVGGRPPPPPGYPYQNSTLYPTSAALGGREPGALVDYAAFYGQTFAALYGYPDPAQPGRFLTLCELADRGIVHELWVVGSGDVPDAGMAEVLESKQRYSTFGSKLAGTFNRCAGNGCFRAEVPVCGRSLRIGLVNYNRGPGCYLESLGHGMESAMGQDIFPPVQKWFVPFAGFDLDTRWNLPFTSLYAVDCATPGSCLTYPSTTSIRIDFFGSIFTRNPWDAICGNVHLAPNAHAQYDLCGGAFNPDGSCNLAQSSVVSTSCTGYGRHGGAGGADLKQNVSSSAWMTPYGALAGDCQGAFLVWWHQNMPMFGSGQTFASGEKMKSVWPYLYY